VKVPHFHRVEVVGLIVLNALVWGYDQSLGPMGSLILSDQYGAVPVRMVAAWHAFREHGWSSDVLSAALRSSPRTTSTRASCTSR
jgi:hypothetical protein